MTHDFGYGPVPAHQHPNGGGWVADTAKVATTARVYGTAWVFGTAQVSGTAWVFGTAQVSGNARVSGNAQVSGNARVSKSRDYVICGPMGSRNSILTLYRCKDGSIGASTGCFSGTVDELLSKAKKEYGYDGPGAHYAALVPVLAAYLDESREVE